MPEAKIHTTTSRFILREIVPGDLEDLWELDSDPAVHRYLGRRSVTSKKQIEEIIKYIRWQYGQNGIGRWAVIDKENGDFLGWTGLKLEDKPTNGHTNYYDLGFRLKPRYWGRGVASETGRESLRYGFEEMGLDLICGGAQCANIGSNRALRKSGMRFVEEFDYEGEPSNWYELEKEEWRRAEKVKGKR